MKEILIEFLFGDPNIQKALAPLAVAAIAAAPGLIKSVGSLFGSGKRRREEGAARKELAQRRQAYESFQFTNPYANMQNTFEDVTVNQQAAQFQAQQQQQGLANVLAGTQQAAGSSGIASLAQALAQQQATNLQASAANIAQQEQQLQMARAGEASRIQTLQAQGAAEKQQFELGRTETLMDAAAQRKARATAERAKARQDLIGGISEAVAAGGSAYLSEMDGGFSKYNRKQNTRGKIQSVLEF
jgi:hypothetical protein